MEAWPPCQSSVRDSEELRRARIFTRPFLCSTVTASVLHGSLFTYILLIWNVYISKKHLSMCGHFGILVLSTYRDSFHGKSRTRLVRAYLLRKESRSAYRKWQRPGSETKYLPLFNRPPVDGEYSGSENKEDRTVLIGAADEGLALRAWPDRSGCRHRDAVLGPLLQPLQHHLLFTGGGGGLLQEVLVHTAAF